MLYAGLNRGTWYTVCKGGGSVFWYYGNLTTFLYGLGHDLQTDDSNTIIHTMYLLNSVFILEGIFSWKQLFIVFYKHTKL